MPEPIRYKHGYRVNFRHKGKRIQRRFPGPPDLAKQQAREYIAHIMGGEASVVQQPIPDLVDTYLRRAQTLGLKAESTLRVDRQRLDVFVRWCRSEGLMQVNRLTPDALRRWQDWHFANAPFGRSRNSNPRRTWEKYRQVVAAFLRWCKDRHLIDINPLAGAVGKEFRIKSQPPDIKVLTDEHLRLIFETARERAPAHVLRFFLIALFTGMRAGEIVGLKWRHVDLVNRTVRVVSTIRGDTKSRKARSIPIHDQLAEVLAGMDRNTRYVLDSGHGCPACTANNYLIWLYRICDQVGIARYRVHDFRHTFAARLIASGADVYTVKELMGHADLRTTISTYGHLMPGQAERAIARIDLPALAMVSRETRNPKGGKGQE